MKKGGQAHEHRNDSGVYRSGGMERRIHSGIYRRTVPKPEAEERFKEEKEPVCSRSLSANSLSLSVLWLYETNAVLPQNRPMRTFHRLESQERSFYPNRTSKTQRLPKQPGISAQNRSTSSLKKIIYQGGQKVGDSQKAERPEDSILLHDHAKGIHRNEKGRL